MAELTGKNPVRGRALLAAVVTLLVLAVAVVAALLSPTTGGTAVIAVEWVSSAIGEVASRAQGLWWVYAFVLGAAAAFNPCGFALVPAYLGLYLTEGVQAGRRARLARAVTVAGAVGASFTALFAAAGIAFSLVSAVLVRMLPWVGLAVGVLLVLAGGWVMSGGHLAVGRAPRLAARLGTRASSSGVRGYTAFGLAYAAASLGCTLPLFMALIGTAAAASGALSALVAFVLYGVGMAAVLAVLTIIAGTIGFELLGRVRWVVRLVGPLGAAVLLTSGAYLIYYWLTTGRPLLI